MWRGLFGNLAPWQSAALRVTLSATGCTTACIKAGELLFAYMSLHVSMVYAHICTYVCAYVCTYIHTQLCTHVCACRSPHALTYLYTGFRTNIYAHLCAHTFACSVQISVHLFTHKTPTLVPARCDRLLAWRCCATVVHCQRPRATAAKVENISIRLRTHVHMDVCADMCTHMFADMRANLRIDPAASSALPCR